MTTPQSDTGEAIRRHGDSQAHGRREDSRLLTGNGRFTADIDPAGTAHAVFLRAPVAHAEIAGIDLSDAAGSPGVLGIVTGADLAALGTLPCSRPPTGRN
ncbi:MAG: xanthine dehydrogenase family protein molybdopterin-binding subunit, partial [Alphaproteobacteria bacterium]|nr:xanthine dehydrogenase family protein molybdopterin-binding subunit [Alphaproteobacteria bacterium]